MPNFIEDLLGAVGPEVSKNLSATLGIDKNTAMQILPQVAPMILGGLKRQMEQRGGAPPRRSHFEQIRQRQRAG